MVRLMALAALLISAPAAGFVGVADTALSMRAFPLEADPGDGTLVTVLQLVYSWRSDGVATGPTEVSIEVAERPPGADAAVVPDHVSIAVPIEATAASRREAPPEHVALVIRLPAETEPGAHLAVLAYARPNGNMKASSATLRLPLDALAVAAPAPPVLEPPTPSEAQNEPEVTPIPASALWAGAAVGAAGGFLLLSVRLRRR